MAHFSFKRFSFNNSRASAPSNHPNRNRVSSPGSQEGLQSGQLSVHKDVQITRDDRSPSRIQFKSSSSGTLKLAYKVPGGPADLNSSPPPFYSVAGVSTSIPDTGGSQLPYINDTRLWRAASEEPDEFGRLEPLQPTVAISSTDRMDDDISAIMRGATDLKNTRKQLDEQRRRVANLETSLEASKIENEQMLQKIKKVKEAAKEGLQKSSVNLAELGEKLKDLQSKSCEFSSFIEQVQASIPEVQDIRRIVAKTTTSIAPLLAESSSNSAARELLQQLQMEISNSQQVVDILRERLTTQGSELIDARCRITDLERIQLDERDNLTNSLCIANRTVTELSAAISQQGHELFQKVSSTIELEANFYAVSEKNSELSATLQQQEKALMEVQSLHDKVHKLDLQLKTSEGVAQDACKLRDEIVVLNTSLRESQTDLTILQAKLKDREENLKNTIDILNKMELEHEAARNSAKALQKELEDFKIREDRAVQACALLKSEKDALEKQIANLERRLRDFETSLENSRESLQSITSKNQALQERFDDQSVILRVTKGTIGDLQERLLSTETSFTRDTEAFKGQIMLLQEQRSNLQSKFDDRMLQLKRQEELTRQLRVDFEERLKDQESNSRTQLQGEEQRRRDCEALWKERGEALKESQAEITKKDQELLNVKEELAKKIQELSKKDQEILIGVQEMMNKDQELSKKDYELVKKEQEVLNKDGEIARIGQEITRKDKEISKRDKDLIAKDSEISRKDKELSATGQALSSKEAEISRKDREIERISRDLINHQIPVDDELKGKVLELEIQLHAVQTERDDSMARATNLNQRYNDGDLNEEERAFIINLIETSQSVHEQELVSKGNEIRRRDNIIQSLQSRIKTLEDAVTRHLKTQATAAEKPSIIDITGLPLQSSPPTSAPDRDVPDLPLTDAVTPSRLPLIKGSIATSSMSRNIPSSEGPKDSKKHKGLFRRLGADQEDDIVEFEDEQSLARPTMRKRAVQETDTQKGNGDDAEPEGPGRSKKQKTYVKKKEPAKKIGPPKHEAQGKQRGRGKA